MRLVLLAAGLFVIWQGARVLLLVFAACLFGVLLNAFARYLVRLSRMPYGAAIALTLLAIIVVISTTVAVLGVQIQGDFAYLFTEVPKTLERELDRLGIDAGAIDLQGGLDSSGWSALLGGLASSAGMAVTALTNAFLVLIGGVFLAAHPKTYRRFLVHLFPRRMCRKTLSVLRNVGLALRHWMLGQLLLMIGIGVVTTIGLMLIGVPSALGLGVLAGLLEFVPLVGPIMAAIPGVLVGFSMGMETGLWTLAFYIVLQQAESTFVIPLIQRRTVSLAPALGLLAILVFGVWLGPLGVVLSAPLAVLIQVVLIQLYSRDRLGWDIPIPGTAWSRPRK